MYATPCKSKSKRQCAQVGGWLVAHMYIMLDPTVFVCYCVGSGYHLKDHHVCKAWNCLTTCATCRNSASVRLRR